MPDQATVILQQIIKDLQELIDFAELGVQDIENILLKIAPNNKEISNIILNCLQFEK